MRSFYLYKISNTINTKVYMGVTCRPRQRWYEHKGESSTCLKLKRALQKYGVENFKFEVICEGSEEYILDLEAKAIVAYDSIKNGYNTIPGGNRAGISLEQETRDKIRASLRQYYDENESPNKGRVVATRSDDEPICVAGIWYPNFRSAVAGTGLNPKTIYKRKRLGTLHLEEQPRVGRKVRPKRGSEEDIARRSASMQGKNAGESNGMHGKKNPSRSRRVCIEGVIYESISAAVAATGYTKSQIEKRLKKNVEGFSYA